MNYDRINEVYNGELYDMSSNTYKRTRNRITWICEQAEGAKVLDVGCSQGIVSILLGREGFQCVGVDNEKVAIDYANTELKKEEKIVRERVNFELAEASNLNFEDNSFHTIILGEIIEHLMHPEKVLKEAKRLLKESGKVIVTVPFGLMLYHDHKRTFYPSSLLDLLSPYFNTTYIEIVEKNIYFIGKSKEDKSNEIKKISEMKLSSIKTLEQKFTEVEYELHNKKSELLKWNEKLNEVTNANNELNNRIEKNESKFSNELNELKNQYEIKSLNIENNFLTKRNKEIEEIKRYYDNLLLEIKEESENKCKKEITEREERMNQILEERENKYQNNLKNINEECRVELLKNEKLHKNELLNEIKKRDKEIRLIGSEIKDKIQQISMLKQKLSVTQIENKESLEKQKKDLEKIYKEKISEIQSTIKSEYETNLIHVKQESERSIKNNNLKLTEEFGSQKIKILQELENVKKLNNNKLYELEKLLKSSVTWRIGRVFVCGLVYTKNFIVNPYKFINNSTYRGKGIIGYIYNPEPLLKSDFNFITHSKSKTRTEFDNKLTKKHRDDKLLSFGSIMDVFTTECFKPECKLITFRPDNWKIELEKNAVDAIFVESAWHGNDGSWQYRVASYQKNMGNELIALINWAENNNLPTIFWNKEDPPNYDRFVEKAGLFDYVFTTDADCIPKYIKDTGNKNVYELPFAAQPLIHNPIVEKDRKKNVCFAGTYYGNKHEERKKDIEFLLKPSLDFGLDIYDRQYGLVGKQTEIFRFPDIYQKAIRGRLNYKEMLVAHKEYKVFLNVNSVKKSPTMFSRRVFELLACGTPVISTYSKGIVNLLGEDTVFITESENDTKNCLELLLNDEYQWKKSSLKGIRRVMSNHTYEERLNFISEKVDLKKSPKRNYSFTVLSKCSDKKSLDNLIMTLNRQTKKPYGCILLAPSDKLQEYREKIGNAFKDFEISGIVNDSSDSFAQCKQKANTKHIAIIDMKDYYGPNYLNDLSLALKYSKADCLGKHTYYAYDSRNKQFNMLKKGYEYKKVKSVLNATLLFDKEKVQINDANEFFNRGMFMDATKNIISIDSFNYARSENGMEISNELIRECERNVIC